MIDVNRSALRTYVCERGEAASLCRNGLLEGSEGCDDGNILEGDGCNLSCAPEEGFTCSGSPSVCEPVCGDGKGLVDEAVDGQWRVCFGNSEAYDLGAVHSLRLQLTQ